MALGARGDAARSEVAAPRPVRAPTRARGATDARRRDRAGPATPRWVRPGVGGRDPGGGTRRVRWRRRGCSRGASSRPGLRELSSRAVPEVSWCCALRLRECNRRGRVVAEPKPAQAEEVPGPFAEKASVVRATRRDQVVERKREYSLDAARQHAAASPCANSTTAAAYSSVGMPGNSSSASATRASRSPPVSPATMR